MVAWMVLEAEHESRIINNGERGFALSDVKSKIY